MQQSPTHIAYMFYIAGTATAAIWFWQICCVEAWYLVPSGGFAFTMVGFDVTGLRKDWDISEALRARMRDGHSLLAGTLHEYTIARCCLNVDILTPVLVRSTMCDHKAPEVENLRDEISGFLAMNHRADAGDDEIDDAAWEIRKLTTFIKRKAKREEVSTAI